MRKIRKNKKNIKKELWSPTLIKVFSKFKSPHDVQAYLDKLKYNTTKKFKSPEMVIRKKSAYCSEGAFFAAAALRFLGYKSLLLYMLANPNDDDHFLALFKQNNCWGAVSKSNFTVLRYREPVYKSIRELVMSYFDFYYNSLGQKTLRAYTAPVNLERFDEHNWMTTHKDIAFIGDYFDEIKQYRVLDKKMIHSLSRVDQGLLKGGLLGSAKAGLFKPKKS
jgi:hypothetical protein